MVRRIRLGAGAMIAAALAFASTVAVANPRSMADTSPIAVTVGTSATSAALPASFLGLSIEYSALHVYAGRDPRTPNPVFLALVRALDPGARPVLRIGGDSTDATWWPIRGLTPPGGVRYALTRDWLDVARAVATDLGARLILGVNLAADEPSLAAAEARALTAGIGRRHIDAFEIGNEPDLYGAQAWYKNRAGEAFDARPSGWDLADYLNELALWRRLLPSGVAVAGPALATGTWLADLPQLRGTGPLAAVTFHRYPLRSCPGPLPAGTQATIPDLLGDTAAEGLAAKVAPYVAAAHAVGAPFRIDELNSSACKGTLGVSNTLASAAWVLDTLYNLAAAGVDAVNVHTLPGAPYAPFSFTDSHGRWRGVVNPVYYGMLMFARAFPAGAHLVSVSAPAGTLKAYATVDTHGTTRIMLINKAPSTAATVTVTDPGAGTAPFAEQLLTGPSATATTGVTLGGASFGAATPTGVLAPPAQASVPQANGALTVTVPAASALLLTS